MQGFLAIQRGLNIFKFKEIAKILSAITWKLLYKIFQWIGKFKIKIIESTTFQFLFSGSDYYVLGSTSNSNFVLKYNTTLYLDEKMLNCSGKYFAYGKLLFIWHKVSLRFVIHDTLHEAFLTRYQEGNIDNHTISLWPQVNNLSFLKFSFYFYLLDSLCGFSSSGFYFHTTCMISHPLPLQLLRVQQLPPGLVVVELSHQQWQSG